MTTEHISPLSVAARAGWPVPDPTGAPAFADQAPVIRTTVCTACGAPDRLIVHHARVILSTCYVCGDQSNHPRAPQHSRGVDRHPAYARTRP